MPGRICLICALMLIGDVCAQGWRAPDGSMTPDAPYRKTAGEYGAWIILVDDLEAFFREWEAPPGTPEIATVSRIERGRFITAIVLFKGCEPSDSGSCDVEAGFEIIQPDGSHYAEMPLQSVWDDVPAPPANMMVMSPLYLRIRIEPGELMGEYNVIAHLKDVNAEITLTVEAPFVAFDP